MPFSKTESDVRLVRNDGTSETMPRSQATKWLMDTAVIRSPWDPDTKFVYECQGRIESIS